MEVQAEKKKSKPKATSIKRLLGKTYEGQYANVRSILHGGRIQPKLRIGQPNDKYEQEADRVAEQVMRMPASHISSSVGGSVLGDTVIFHRGTIQRDCTACVKDEAIIQTKTNESITPKETPEIGAGIQSLQGGGQPLSYSERGFFESRIGADFSNVRVHNSMQAANVARSINARAFTHGHNVVFGAGEYSPNTLSGKKLLAHELTHVVQQNALGSQNIQRQAGNNETELTNRNDLFCHKCPKRKTLNIAVYKQLTNDQSMNNISFAKIFMLNHNVHLDIDASAGVVPIQYDEEKQQFSKVETVADLCDILKGLEKQGGFPPPSGTLPALFIPFGNQLASSSGDTLGWHISDINTICKDHVGNLSLNRIVLIDSNANHSKVLLHEIGHAVGNVDLPDSENIMGPADKGGTQKPPIGCDPDRKDNKMIASQVKKFCSGSF